jgi:lipopolysaccharide O-acetyltransferase
MIQIIRTYGWSGLVRIAYSLICTKLFYCPARLIRRPVYIRGRRNIRWGQGFTTGVGIRLDAFGGGKETKLFIGDRVQLDDYVHIGAIHSVIIGNDVLIASRVFISDHHHGNYQGEQEHSSPQITPASRPLISQPINIGDRVWIGEGVSVLAGVQIGEGAVIGAGAVVTKDIPPNTIAVGIPAKVIKKFDPVNEKWISL